MSPQVRKKGRAGRLGAPRPQGVLVLYPLWLFSSGFNYQKYDLDLMKNRAYRAKLEQI